MHIPNKPAKYGTKLVLANDVHSKYLLAGMPYLGKQVTQPQGGQSLKHHQINRNVTTDNWSTSVPLVINLLENCSMSLEGTVNANKTETPHMIKDKEIACQPPMLFLSPKNFITKQRQVSILLTRCVVTMAVEDKLRGGHWCDKLMDHTQEKCHEERGQPHEEEAVCACFGTHQVAGSAEAHLFKSVTSAQNPHQ